MEQNKANRASSTRTLLAAHRASVVWLSINSFVGGVLEALFLVIVTRSAFAITDGDDGVGLIAGRTASIGTAVLLALFLVVLRVAVCVGRSLAVRSAEHDGHSGSSNTTGRRLPARDLGISAR